MLTWAYGFNDKTQLRYDVNVQFEGFLPLMGGNEGKVEVKMGVDVSGQKPESETLRASHEIKEFEVSFNGAKLPLSVSNVEEYFPKTSIEFSTAGKILKTNAPDKKLPVRLPGLDVKHFPDITYIPIELPVGVIDSQQSWTFERNFGGAPMSYSCKVQSIEKNLVMIEVKLEQKYVVLENSSVEIVTSKDDAVNEVSTTLNGEGNIVFDTDSGTVKSATMKNVATSDVRPLPSGEMKHRKLTTNYVISLKKGSGAQRQSAIETSDHGNWFENAISFGQQTWNNTRNIFLWFQTASLFGLDSLPKHLSTALKPFKPYLNRWANLIRF